MNTNLDSSISNFGFLISYALHIVFILSEIRKKKKQAEKRSFKTTKYACFHGAQPLHRTFNDSKYQTQ